MRHEYAFVRANDDPARRRRLQRLKQGAAARHHIAQEVEEALRADLHSRREVGLQEPFQTPVFDGDDAAALVDVNDNRALLELMDEEDADARR